MQYRAAGYALIALAIILILFDLFLRYRYVAAGNEVWRIDRVTEKACIVRLGDAICSPSSYSERPTLRIRPTHNPYLGAPTPEPNPP